MLPWCLWNDARSAVSDRLMCMQSTLMEHHPHLAHANGVAMSPVAGMHSTTKLRLCCCSCHDTACKQAASKLCLRQLHVCLMYTFLCCTFCCTTCEFTPSNATSSTCYAAGNYRSAAPYSPTHSAQSVASLTSGFHDPRTPTHGGTPSHSAHGTPQSG